MPGSFLLSAPTSTCESSFVETLQVLRLRALRA